MPRSSLRRPGQKLDLSRHLYESEQLPSELSSSSLFQNDLPLELEIGSGKGLFIDNASEQNPTHNFVGVEIIAKYAKHSAAKLARKNFQRIDDQRECGDAARKINIGRKLEAVHVYFPDPWWKKTSQKKST